MAGAGKARIADRDDTGRLACVTSDGRLCVSAIIVGDQTMLEFTHLSESTNGRPINVSSSGTDTDLHEVPTGKIDCLSIYACNNADTFRRLEFTISSGSDLLEVNCPPHTTVIALAELILAAGETVECTLDGGASGDVNVYGKVERRDA